ncbi:phosphatase 2C [Coemansia sp. RSA 552]|nr:phosphatase 2C [Coemansia sp. RSA 552]
MSSPADNNAPQSLGSAREDDDTLMSPTDGIVDGAPSGTATFPNSTNAIQPPARLQRSFIPPPIDTENASKDADGTLRSKLLSLSPMPLGSSAGQAAAQGSGGGGGAKTVPGVPGGIEPLVLESAGEGNDQPKCSGDTDSAHIGVAFSKNRRYRRTMEDAHYHKYDFDGVSGQAFMAIFDGHAGRQAANWCGDNFADIFLRLRAEHSAEPVPEVLNRTFIEADRRLAADVKTHSGCTAVVAFVEVTEAADGDAAKRQRTLYCANVGDARAVLSRDGTARRLTYDHKGDDAHEIERISEAGGYVFNGRVNGILAVTRALGDSSLKQFVIGNPFTTETKLSATDDLLILACDGLWDVCTDQEAVDLIRQEQDPTRASEILRDYALDNDSMDNITTMAFRLPPLAPSPTPPQ